MATLLKVNRTIINLDAVTDIELEACSARASEPQAERVIRIHFTTPAGLAEPAGTIPPTVRHRTLELREDDAAAFRRYLEYEAIDVTNDQALERA